MAKAVGGVGVDFVEKMVACKDMSTEGVIYDLQVRTAGLMAC